MKELNNGEVILQLERVASAVSSALFAIIAKSAEADTRKALWVISREAAALSVLLDPPELSGKFVEATDPYSSPDVPEGYQTVLGYMHEVNPDIFEIADGRTAWAKDEAWIEKTAQARNLPVAQVEACGFLKGHGVAISKAYPRSLIRERLY